MIIYKATNSVNGKIYIGQTINTLEYRKSQHLRDVNRTNRPLTYFHNAIKKYGKENFVFEEIDTAETIDELNQKEIMWISYYNSTDKAVGYNLDYGGTNSFKSEETKKKIGEKTKERWKDSNIAAKMRAGLKMGNETQKNKPKQRVVFTCSVCGKQLELFPYQANGKKYCSAKCHGVAFANDVATQEKIKLANKHRDDEYKKLMRDKCVDWVLIHADEIESCKYNKISPVLNPLLAELNIKDYRTLARFFDLDNRKDTLTLFKSIINNN